MLKFKLSSCRGSGFTPESNLTYLSSQDNFLLMPYCSLKPQECEKTLCVLCKMHSSKLSYLHINLHIHDMNEISKHEVEIVK